MLSSSHILKSLRKEKNDENIWKLEQAGVENEEKPERPEHGGEPNQDDDEKVEDLTDRFPLKQLFFYKEHGSKMLSDSDHAAALGLTRVSMTDIMSLKSQLEKIVWEEFAKSMEQSKCHEWLMVNINDTQLKSHPSSPSNSRKKKISST